AGGSSGTGGGGTGTAAPAVSLGGNHACAVKANGTVWCWGANNAWQTGSPGADKLVPAQGMGLSGATQGSLGSEFWCAFASVVNCWGAGNSGQLGNGQANTTASPVVAIVPSPSAISVPVEGHWHACALAADKSAWCWGYNKDGVLGNGVADSQSYST